MDVSGLENRLCRALWTFLVVCGYRLEIYGSGGWVFESPRARYMKPPDEVAVSAFEIREPIDLSDVRVPRIVETHETRPRLTPSSPGSPFNHDTVLRARRLL